MQDGIICCVLILALDSLRVLGIELGVHLIEDLVHEVVKILAKHSSAVLAEL